MKKITTLIILSFSVFLAGCEKKPNEDESPETPIEDEIMLPSEDELKALPYYSYLKANNPIVVISVKDYGEMMIELFPDVAKVTVDNFINYVNSKDYQNSSFHRIIKNFMIQGGIVKNTQPPIVGEFSSNGIKNNLLHDRGVISMARTMVNNSATSQFFVMHAKSPHLDGNYAGFGGLLKGFEVLDQIANVKTNPSDAPTTPVVIENVTLYLRGYQK